jgi:uncharacterized cupredoxin-like copper-binding protein
MKLLALAAFIGATIRFVVKNDGKLLHETGMTGKATSK